MIHQAKSNPQLLDEQIFSERLASAISAPRKRRATNLISRQNSKRAPIANRYGFKFVTDLAHEFVARSCGPSHSKLSWLVSNY